MSETHRDRAVRAVTTIVNAARELTEAIEGHPAPPPKSHQRQPRKAAPTARPATRDQEGPQ